MKDNTQEKNLIEKNEDNNIFIKIKKLVIKAINTLKKHKTYL